MEFVIILLVLIVIGAVLATQLPRGRRSKDPTVRKRLGGRD